MADDEDDTDKGLAGLSPEFQAMVGGLAGHTAMFAKMLEKRSAAFQPASGQKKDDEEYLESYADLAIHEDMLKDMPRVEAYRKAIEAHSASWKESGDVTIADVGAGTGVLSLLCARAGAHRVLAVEASRLAYFLRQIVEANAPQGVVDIRECLAEDLELSEGQKVDVIVSEWMGYFLLFENMLPSVLSVRDKHLKPGGLMLPSSCRLLVAPLEDTAWRDSKVKFWRDVHGFDMSALVPLAIGTACERPQHRLIPAEGLLADAIEVLSLDLATVRDADLQRFEAQLDFEVPEGRRLDGFASWFDCDFGTAGRLLSTAPSKPATHWRQTAFYFRQPIEASCGALRVSGKITVERHEEYSRGYRVCFDLGAVGKRRRNERFELR